MREVKEHVLACNSLISSIPHLRAMDKYVEYSVAGQINVYHSQIYLYGFMIPFGS